MHEMPIESGRESQPAAFHELPRRQLVLTIAGLMCTLLLSALDQTIVGTAMPRIVADLQGFEHYAWVTTAYLLTSTTVVPIVGKLSDLYGRKLFLLGGAVFFVATSALCGLSQDMTQLVLFRGLQGIGGGVLMATVFTTVSAIFPPAERGKYQGLFSAIFGLASIAGPLLGGYLTDNLTWRWVFYVNVPVGVVAVTVLWLAFPDIRPNAARRPRIDYWGAVTLVAAVVPLLLALSWAGTEYAWGSTQVVGLFVLAVVMTGAFLMVETRTPEPIIPLDLFGNQIVSVSSLMALIMAIAMFGTILFIPLFIQGVIGSSATASGTVLTPLMLAMILSSMAAGQVISRTGRYRLMAWFGMIVTTIGMFLLAGMGADTDYETVVRNMVIVGLGLGPTMPVFTLAAQNAVPFSRLGVVTSVTQFARSIGGTLGAAIFGSLLINGFGPALQKAMPPQVTAAIPPAQLAQLANPQELLNPDAAAQMQQGAAQLGPQGAQIFAALMEAVKVALATSLHDMFFAGAVISAIGILATFFLKEIPLRKTYGRPHPVPAEAAAETSNVSPLRPRARQEDEGAVVARR